MPERTKRNLLLRRPLLVGAAYLALIPFFAAIYIRMPPKSFYEPALKRERYYLGMDAARVRSDVTASVNANLRTRSFEYSDIGTFDIREIHADQIQVTDDQRVVMRVAGTATIGPAEAPTAVATFGVYVEVLLFDGRSGVQVPGQPLVLSYFVKRTGPRGQPATAVVAPQPTVAMLFPQSLGQGQDPDVGSMQMSVGSYDRLVKFFDAVSGDPKSASGYVVRMGYLSIEVVTTLGLGDIVPVTTPARVAIGIEAAAGVVLVGLFLYALTNRRPRSSIPEVSPPKDV